jgi:hypothetical protein
MNVITLFSVSIVAGLGALLVLFGHPGVAVALWIVAAVTAPSPRMASAWERFVVLRAGQLDGIRGPAN